MKIVLLGKDGQLGTEFQQFLPILGETLAFGRNELDLTDLKLVQDRLMEIKPDLIVNAAAYTNVDLAETEIEAAMRVNAELPGAIAETAASNRAAFVHFSTDYVFDGRSTIPYTENDITAPINIYGHSKLQGEENVEKAGGAYLVLRTSWVYGNSNQNFVNKVLAWSRKNEIVRVVDDQISCPTWARTLAATVTIALGRLSGNIFEEIHLKRGVFHVAGSGHTSRYEWAKQILLDDPNQEEQVIERLDPVSSLEFPTPAIRPLFSALDSSYFQKTFDVLVPAWQTTLQLALRR